VPTRTPQGLGRVGLAEVLVVAQDDSCPLTTAVLRTARAVAPSGIVAVLYEGLGKLPHFNPDDESDPLHPGVAALRGRIHGADAVVFSTPEYAGALPGSFKNLLD
jgi:chromate reductase